MPSTLYHMVFGTHDDLISFVNVNGVVVVQILTDSEGIHLYYLLG